MLVWAVVTVFTVGALVLTATIHLRALTDLSSASFAADGQAQVAAEAGLNDAYAWLRRQPAQPVASFLPRRDLDADPPINETDDPSIGLVREYEWAPGLWARYEVRPGSPAESYTDRNRNGVYDGGEPFSDDDANGVWTPAKGTRDVTQERGMSGSGAVWRLLSRGRVFRRSDASLPLGEGPNVQLATAERAVEVRRLALLLPASAGLSCMRASHVTLGSRTRVRSGSLSVAYPTSTGTAHVTGAELLSPSQTAGFSPWADDVTSVFGLSWSELRATADLATSDPAVLPDPIGHKDLVVITADVTFDGDLPLNGSGIVVVRGDVEVAMNSNSSFSGLLYVEGDLTLRGPCFLQGAIVVRGKIDARGTGADFVEVVHDPALVTSMLLDIGQYRFAKRSYVPLPTTEDGRPNERSQAHKKGRGNP